MRRLALTGGWFVVVVLTTALTWQIVSAADNRVSERPSSPLNVAAPQLQSSSAVDSTTLPAVDAQTTSIPALSSTSTPAPTTSTTSSSAPTGTSAPTTSTTSATEWLVKTTSSIGGTLVVKYRPEEVVFQAASPAAGFHVEVDKRGPPEVEVEFESETQKVEIRVKWDHGELTIEVSTSEDD